MGCVSSKASAAAAGSGGNNSKPSPDVEVKVIEETPVKPAKPAQTTAATTTTATNNSNNNVINNSTSPNAGIIAKTPTPSGRDSPAKSVGRPMTNSQGNDLELTAGSLSVETVEGKHRSTKSNVEYEGDRALDTKRAEHHASLALRAKRRGDVFVEHIEQRDRYSIAMIPKSEEQTAIIEKALRANVLFNELGDTEIAMMVGAMKSKTCTAGETIITQGDKGDNFYVVESGCYEFKVDNVKVGQGEGGSTFGELALLYNSPRAATVVASAAGTLWVLPRDVFRKIVSANANKTMHEVQNALKSVTLLQGLSDEQITQLCDLVAVVHFKAGDTIIRKGDTGSIFYFIKHGEVECTKIGNDENALNLELGPGDYFGERALMKSEPRAANVIARTDVECIALEKADFERHLGSLMERLDANLGIRVLKSLPILKDLSIKERSAIVEDFKMRNFEDGEYIVRQGEKGVTFYIIREGVAEVSKRMENSETRAIIANLNAGDYFGEGALLQDEPRGADVIAKGPVKTFELDREAFDRHMNTMKSKMQRHLSKRMDETADAVKKARRGIEAQIKFSELIQIRTLGTGTFGRVKLVQHKKLNMTFALKILQKAQVVAYKQQVNVMNEKDVMAECDHPFILRLFKTFKDKNCLYMLLELVQGGELFSLLHIRGGKLGDKDARFYAGCVLDGLEYLHDRTIVYRDLKPENLLIDDVGYIKIVDFGFAKKIVDKTYTLCGTPEYLSPELVLGKGHNKGVDYWALGILIYEMIVGNSPFYDQSGNGDHMVICKNIVKAKLEFTRKFPEKAKELVTQLLVRESHLRLGCLKNGAADIKTHPWFKSLDFNDLFRKRIKAPWVPEIKSALDASNFEIYDEDDDVEQYNEKTGGNWDANF